MTWHASTAQIDRYVSGVTRVSDAMSLEAHLPECARCRHLLARRSDQGRLEVNWMAIEAQLGLSTAPLESVSQTRERDCRSDGTARRRRA